MPVADLLQHNAHYFNLENKRVMFQPIGDVRYKVTTSEARTALRRGVAVNRPEPGKFSSRLPLQFTFPFAGKRCNQVYINWNGNLTFDGPESAEYPERYTWADGTMRSLASGGTERPISMADIGPIEVKPQRNFQLGIYLLHENDREPSAAKLDQARGLEAALCQYFSVATKGLMTVRPTTAWQ